MEKNKVYPYMKRKQQINVNISKRVLEDMDKERLEIDLMDISFGGVMSRSEFIQKAVINWIMKLRKLKEKEHEAKDE